VPASLGDPQLAREADYRRKDVADIIKLPKLTFSTREVAAMLGVSRPTVDRLVADGFLPSVDLGSTRRTLIPAWAIEELVARPQPTTSDPDQTSRGLAT
jgi:excisionase family DNA binding protein